MEDEFLQFYDNHLNKKMPEKMIEESVDRMHKEAYRRQKKLEEIRYENEEMISLENKKCGFKAKPLAASYNNYNVQSTTNSNRILKSPETTLQEELFLYSCFKDKKVKTGNHNTHHNGTFMSSPNAPIVPPKKIKNLKLNEAEKGKMKI